VLLASAAAPTGAAWRALVTAPTPTTMGGVLLRTTPATLGHLRAPVPLVRTTLLGPAAALGCPVTTKGGRLPALHGLGGASGVPAMLGGRADTRHLLAVLVRRVTTLLAATLPVTIRDEDLGAALDADTASLA
jgi:hypothetical protein